MSQTFRHPWWSRLVTVDEEGIHEHRRDRLFTSIPWEELSSLNRGGVRSRRGERIQIRLSANDAKQFEKCAGEMWKKAYPERWESNRQRMRRQLNWIIYCWYPVLTLGPIITCYALFWALGWPLSLRPELHKLHRIAGLGALSVIALCLWYGYCKRKRVEPAAGGNAR